MSVIKEIKALQVYDSRGNPTIKVWVKTEKGTIGEAMVPSGASTGIYEARELRDSLKKDTEMLYDGFGVSKAVERVLKAIKPELLKKKISIDDQEKIDQTMIDLDKKLFSRSPCCEAKVSNKCCLGANAILAVSMACARAAAQESGIPLYEYIRDLYNKKVKNKVGKLKNYVLPCPMANIINGGSHVDQGVDMQEYMVAPYGAKSFTEAVHMVFKTYKRLKEILKRNKLSTCVGDEGGFAPKFDDNKEPIKYILEAIKDTEFEPGSDLYITMDPASSEFYDQDDHRFGNRYKLSEYEDLLNFNKMIEVYKEFIDEFPEIISIEDGLAQNDWKGWIEMTKELGSKIQLVGDDLFVTCKNRLKEGIDKKAANAILIKLNQIGTLTETLETIILAKNNDYNTVISHRSGETCDTFIADLAVAVNAGQIKTGALCRSERVSKYNRLLEIEVELGKKCRYVDMKKDLGLKP